MSGSLTLPTEAQTLDADERLEVLKKVGLGTPMTDLAVITGGYISSIEVATGENSDHLGPPLNQHSALYMTRSTTGVGSVWGVYDDPVFKKSAATYCFDPGATKAVIRPMMPTSFMVVATNFISSSPKETYTDERTNVEEIAYGEYPQFAVSPEMQEELENNLQSRNLYMTGKNYTFNSPSYERPKTVDGHRDNSFKPTNYSEYEYQGKKYVRVNADINIGAKSNKIMLANGRICTHGDSVWLEVSPVIWYVDKKSQFLISKYGLLSGIRFDDKKYYGKFEETEIKKYMDNYMANNLVLTSSLKKEIPLNDEEAYSYNFSSERTNRSR